MTPAPWHWLVLGGVLLLLEAFTMGFACLWLAVGAGLTGLLLWLVPALPWQAQVLAFALCAVGALGGWRWWRRRSPVLPADPALNRRGASHVGGETVLVAGIGPGHGRVRVADGTWLADGPPLPAGTRVRIVGADGPVLHVVPAGEVHPDGPAAATTDRPSARA
ncbi:NfeD family protein [Benzoatithermus flavus]|uniref:NfeD family protein n=1 Tax=Benzoatithermus flavus TaxID=3108223 RepID=A0ABU8XVF5_9PROT